LNKYLIIGARPPPRGGVAVYLERKVAYLKAQGCQVDWCNPRELLSLVKKLLVQSCRRSRSIIELHTAHTVAIFLVSFLRIESAVVFFDHNYSSGFQERGAIARYLLVRFLNRVGQIVIVSEHLKKNYFGLIPPESVDQFKIEVPYIPLSSDYDQNKAIVSPAISNFLQKYPVVILNAAWRLVDDVDGSDLYGLQWSLESFLSHYQNDIRVGFLAVVGDNQGERLNHLVALASKIGNVLVMVGEHDLCSILCKTNTILLRTTSTDGDSLSVREALELGRAVIASDIVVRPKGAIQYHYGSREDFEQHLISEINVRLSKGGDCE